MHLCTLHNKRACMSSLDWSPCGWLSISQAINLIPHFSVFAASDSSPCKYGAAGDLEQPVGYPLAASGSRNNGGVEMGYTNCDLAPLVLISCLTSVEPESQQTAALKRRVHPSHASNRRGPASPAHVRVVASWHPARPQIPR